MVDEDRVLNALDCLEVIAREAGNFLKNPSETNRNFLEDALTKYESGDAYDFVSDSLYRGSERII